MFFAELLDLLLLGPAAIIGYLSKRFVCVSDSEVNVLLASVILVDAHVVLDILAVLVDLQERKIVGFEGRTTFLLVVFEHGLFGSGGKDDRHDDEDW